MPPRRVLVAIAVLGALLRLGVAVPGLGRPPDDPDNYVAIARSVAGGHGYQMAGRPTAYRPPLYPLVLVPLVRVAGERLGLAVAVLHAALGAATVALTAATARRWGWGGARACAAAALVAVDPILVAQARMPMTETLAALLVALVLYTTADARPWRGALLGGLASGLAALCRPSLLAATMLAMLARVLAPGEPLARRIGCAALLGLGTIAVLAPWAARNERVFGQRLWTTTHGGYTLALANNAYYYADVLDGPPGATWGGSNQTAWWDELNRRTWAMPEPDADRVLKAEGWRMLRDRPADFVRASAARLRRFWGLAPARSVYPPGVRLAIAAWTVPLWIALAAGLGDRRAWAWPRSVALAFLVGLTAVHAIYWTDLRMRSPLVPAIALVAAGAGLRASGRGCPSPDTC